MPQTKEKQYGVHLRHQQRLGAAALGITASYLWHHDPKHLLFTLARYKFTAKLLAGQRRVAEIGCGDAFGSRLVGSTVDQLDGFDFDPIFIANAKTTNSDRHNQRFFVHDILAQPLPKRYDGLYALDVLEHIRLTKEPQFMRHLAASLRSPGILIIGTPNLTSQRYASPPSKQGHVNCKNYDALQQLLQRYFHTVFLFSMNDEVVHTGFGPMAHYLFGVGIGRRANL